MSTEYEHVLGENAAEYTVEQTMTALQEYRIKTKTVPIKMDTVFIWRRWLNKNLHYV